MPESTVEHAVESRRAGNTLVLGLAGELDVFAALQCGPQIDRVLMSHPATTVADLRRVTFLDCSGLALLLRVRKQVARWGGEFAVHCPDRRTLRVVQYVQLAAPLALVETLPAEVPVAVLLPEPLAVEPRAAGSFPGRPTATEPPHEG